MGTGTQTLSQKRREALGYNPKRTPDLFAETHDGYIIAQDIACQHEFVLEQRTPDGHQLMPIASINRSFQGLSELVAICPANGDRYSFIFDISNDVYQQWMRDQLGDLYERNYTGKPRSPAR